MTIHKKNRPKYPSERNVVNRLMPLALLAAALMLSAQSCSSMPETIKPGNPGTFLKKRICITRFDDRKRFDDAYLEQPFQDRLINALLDDCRKPVFVVPGQSRFPAELEPLPKLASGFTDNMAIADIGRKNGFNAVITGVISDIRQKDEISWLTGDRSYFQVTIAVEIYDTQTAAKLLDKAYLHEVEVDVAKATESEKETEYYDIVAIEKVVERIVDEMRTDICDTVSHIPWLGFIVAADGESVTISAGQNVGLKPGTHLTIYQNDRVMTGALGNAYRIPGPPVGELKLVSVSENQSKAVIVDGTGAIAGNSVSLK